MPMRDLCAAFLKEKRRQRDRRDPDGHVDEEDPGPVQVGRQHTPEQDAGGGPTP